MDLCDLTLPEPSAGQVRVRVEYVGICGSDLHYYYHGENAGFVLKEPLIPGHELSGTVDLDPTGRWSPGAAVTAHPARYGPPQKHWSEHPHLWPGGSYLGSASTWPHTQGALADFILVDAEMLRTLPAGLSTRTAALAEPLGVSLHGVRVAGGVEDARVLVAGAGPIGLLSVAAARAEGAADITVSDVMTGPLERARLLGADHTVDVSAETLPESSYDVVLECSGAGASVSSALKAVRPAGTVVQVGMISDDSPGPSIGPLVTKEVTLRGAFRFSDELDDALALLASERRIASVITHEFSLEAAHEAFVTAADPELSGKVLISLRSVPPPG